MVLGLEASDEDPTCSTEREEDIREPERLLVGDVSARKARLAKVYFCEVRFCQRILSLLSNQNCHHSLNSIDKHQTWHFFFGQNSVRLKGKQNLEVDLSMSLVDPLANPSPSPLSETWFSFIIINMSLFFIFKHVILLWAILRLIQKMLTTYLRAWLQP